MSATTPSTPAESHNFTAADHSKILLQRMHNMRNNRQLCDVELLVGDSCVAAHRAVLAACSDYFTAMFTNDLVEKRQKGIRLYNVDPAAVSLLVDFAYTGDLHIHEDNVQALLPAASVLQMTCVRDVCCHFLLRNLHPTNCLGIHNFADTHACSELQARSHKYALENFEAVCSCEEFLRLSFQQVIDLVSSDCMTVSSEEAVFTSVIKWIKHDHTARAVHTPELMLHVKFPLMSSAFLLSVVDSEPLISGSAACRDLLLEALKYHLQPEQRALISSARTVERRPEATAPYMFAVGGGSLFAVHSECEVFSPRQQRWLACASMSCRRSRAGVVSDGRRLYTIGGYDGTGDLSSAEVYCPQSDSWRPLAAMGGRRSCFGAAMLGGLVYCCGGYDGVSCLSTVERYDPLSGTWSSLPQMNCRRRYCRLTAIDQCLYVVGGFDSASYLSTVERLDPRTGKWSVLPPMFHRRSSCGVDSLLSNLYCVGGNDGNACQSSAERFNMRRNAWETVASMNSKRSTHELVSMEGRLFALGGIDGSSSLSSVESFDERLNKWQTEPSMGSRRSSVGCAVLHCVGLEKLLRQKHWAAGSGGHVTSMTSSARAARPRNLLDPPSSGGQEKHVRRERRFDSSHRGTL